MSVSAGKRDHRCNLHTCQLETVRPAPWIGVEPLQPLLIPARRYHLGGVAVASLELSAFNADAVEGKAALLQQKQWPHDVGTDAILNGIP